MKYYFAHQTLTCDENKGTLSCEVRPRINVRTDMENIIFKKKVGYYGDEDNIIVPQNLAFVGKLVNNFHLRVRTKKGLIWFQQGKILMEGKITIK
jgi:hypothetical protein